ncbi:MAG: hypothetical protein WEB03_14430 [Nitriliruptor sp.]|uniref:hypothetical protein n=1 Tax=Nitriliruptor sp. TaxID=2448056 RepID=UPI0034A068BE
MADGQSAALIAFGSAAAGATLGGLLAMFGSWVAERRAAKLRRRERVEDDVHYVDDRAGLVAGSLIDPQVNVVALDSAANLDYQRYYSTLRRLEVSTWAVPRKRRREFEKRLDRLILVTTLAYAEPVGSGRMAPKSLVLEVLANRLGPAFHGEREEARRLAAANQLARRWWGEPIYEPEEGT